MVKFVGEDKIVLKAYAKVNLALDVGEKMDNGYHFVDTVMCDINIYDAIALTVRKDKKIRIAYKNGEIFKNDTAALMAKLICDKYDTNGVNILIDKYIPISSGLGGSSADAAGIARGMEALFDIKVDINTLLEVGSDVPFMYHGGAARVQGVGEVVYPIKLPPLRIALLVDARIKMDTKSVYDMYDIVGGERVNIDSFLSNLDSPRNSLERAAIGLDSNISALKKLLAASGFDNPVMTGSGGGVIAFSQDKTTFDLALAKLAPEVIKRNGLKLFAFNTEML
ncbi:MAG: 4-(cytidine 5'-diphospho)-2-C-methyl-D-erythritol kinase [Clostridia bacterium]